MLHWDSLVTPSAASLCTVSSFWVILGPGGHSHWTRQNHLWEHGIPGWSKSLDSCLFRRLPQPLEGCSWNVEQNFTMITPWHPANVGISTVILRSLDLRIWTTFKMINVTWQIGDEFYVTQFGYTTSMPHTHTQDRFWCKMSRMQWHRRQSRIHLVPAVLNSDHFLSVSFSPMRMIPALGISIDSLDSSSAYTHTLSLYIYRINCIYRIIYIYIYHQAGSAAQRFLMWPSL